MNFERGTFELIIFRGNQTGIEPRIWRRGRRHKHTRRSILLPVKGEGVTDTSYVGVNPLAQAEQVHRTSGIGSVGKQESENQKSPQEKPHRNKHSPSAHSHCKEELFSYTLRFLHFEFSLPAMTRLIFLENSYSAFRLSFHFISHSQNDRFSWGIAVTP